jgi:hypothetical protein
MNLACSGIHLVVDGVRTLLTVWTWFNREGQNLPNRRAAGATGESLDVNEDILATLRWLDEPEAPLIIPRFQVPA